MLKIHEMYSPTNYKRLISQLKSLDLAIEIVLQEDLSIETAKLFLKIPFRESVHTLGSCV